MLVGSIGGRGGIKMASASKTSANEPAKDLILVHTVQLKPIIKAQISEKLYIVILLLQVTEKPFTVEPLLSGRSGTKGYP